MYFKENNMRGFTLVELLAVIVILAIILVIAVPKVINVIDDSKKATLESTAKMIASTAEKTKVQNTLLGKTEDVTCESIAKLNNEDYESCSIKFDGNTAKVTIKGSGKFEGLYVCDGTKTNATTTNESCPMPYGIGSTYITNLLEQESILHNVLVQTYATIDGETVDAGIRYSGPIEGDNAVKNKVYFNCKDKDTNNVNYGENNYDYAGSCEVWRIIGLFDVKSTENETEIPVKRIKLVRDSFVDSDGKEIKMSWDSSSINFGWGINQWGPSQGYEGADLMQMLNGYYIGKSDKCVYCSRDGSSSCANVCTDDVAQLSTISLGMVDDALWHLGAITFSEPVLLSTTYEEERGTQTGKTCKQDDVFCSDSVIRTTTWIGKIGLIYPSDYAYASTNEECASNIFGSDSKCKINNWLYNGYYWTITPSNAEAATGVVMNTGRSVAYITEEVRPSLYLSSNVKIIGGNGGDEPYKLGL